MSHGIKDQNCRLKCQRTLLKHTCACFTLLADPNWQMSEKVLKYLRVPASSRQTYEDSNSWASKRLVWIPDQKEGFVQAAMKSEDGDEVTCQREDTRELVTVSVTPTHAHAGAQAQKRARVFIHLHSHTLAHSHTLPHTHTLTLAQTLSPSCMCFETKTKR